MRDLTHFNASYFYNPTSGYFIEKVKETGRVKGEFLGKVHRPHADPYEIILYPSDLTDYHQPVEKQEFMKMRIKNCLKEEN